MTATNPNGANQYVVDPRQALFLASYINPKSETFSNALQSALKAGYSQEYAESITHLMPNWLSESMADSTRLQKAEKVLDKTLTDGFDLEPIIVEGEEVGEKKNPALTKIQQDSAKFVAERLGKAKYSTKVELEQSGELNISIVNYAVEN